MKHAKVAWVVGMLGLAAMQALGADPKDQFEQLYGDEARKVQATADTKDDAAMAEKLLTGAKALKDDPAFALYVLEKAYELGMKNVAGAATAIEAATLAANKTPDRKKEWMDKALAAAKMQYDKAATADRAKAADAYLDTCLGIADSQMVARKYADAAEAYRNAARVGGDLKLPKAADAQSGASLANARVQAEKKLAEPLRKLKEDPKNAAVAKTLAMLYLAELDDPAEAAKYAEVAADEPMRAHLPDAAKPVKALSEDACLDLGNWYKSLTAAAEVGALGHFTMCQHAKACYGQFLETHAKSDGDRLKAQTFETEVVTRMRPLAKSLGIRIPEFDGMPMFNGKDFTGWRGAQGSDTWKVQDQCIVFRGGKSGTIFHIECGDVKLRENFVVQMEVKARNAAWWCASAGMFKEIDLGSGKLPDDWCRFRLLVAGKQCWMTINDKPTPYKANVDVQRAAGLSLIVLAKDGGQTEVMFRNLQYMTLLDEDAKRLIPK